MTDREIARMVDAWIAKHGVTRCPAAVCAPTTGIDILAVDAAIHRARLDPMAATWTPKAVNQRGWAGYWARKKLAKKIAEYGQ